MADEKKEGYIIVYPFAPRKRNDNAEFVALDDFIEINENNFLHYKRKTKSGRNEEAFINLSNCLYYKLMTN